MWPMSSPVDGVLEDPRARRDELERTALLTDLATLAPLTWRRARLMRSGRADRAVAEAAAVAAAAAVVGPQVSAALWSQLAAHGAAPADAAALDAALVTFRSPNRAGHLAAAGAGRLCEVAVLAVAARWASGSTPRAVAAASAAAVCGVAARVAVRVADRRSQAQVEDLLARPHGM
jgi:hypothetical protein